MSSIKEIRIERKRVRFVSFEWAVLKLTQKARGRNHQYPTEWFWSRLLRSSLVSVETESRSNCWPILSCDSRLKQGWYRGSGGFARVVDVTRANSEHAKKVNIFNIINLV